MLSRATKALRRVAPPRRVPKRHLARAGRRARAAPSPPEPPLTPAPDVDVANWTWEGPRRAQRAGRPLPPSAVDSSIATLPGEPLTAAEIVPALEEAKGKDVVAVSFIGTPSEKSFSPPH